MLDSPESAARTMLGKCYLAFVRNFIDILAEHHANSKNADSSDLNRRRLSGLASEASQRGAQDEARWMVVDCGGTSGKGEDYFSALATARPTLQCPRAKNGAE